MFLREINALEVAEHQALVRSHYASSQHTFTVDGLRELIGNTFIQIGASIHGKAKDVCQEAEARRQAEQLLRGAGSMVK